MLITLAITAVAFLLKARLGYAALSPLVLAMVLGAVIKNTGVLPPSAEPGIKFSSRRLLRGGIVLVGLQLTLAEVLAVGINGLAMLLVCLIGTFAATVWLGEKMGIDRRLVELIAAGTSVCGASAVLATNTVSGADEEDVAYAVACVTAFGTAAVILYPILDRALGLSPHAYGLWAGASIHEIAQVAAATFSSTDTRGHVAMVAKLSRVAMLAPLVFGLAAMHRHKGQATEGQALPFPWFLLMFVLMMLISSTGIVPGVVKDWVSQLATALLCAALAGMGLDMDLRKIGRKGWRPLLLGAAASLLISAGSLTWVCLTVRS